MKRVLSAFAGFVALPLFYTFPVWLPLLLGASGQELERLEINAYPLYRIVPSLALSGLVISWVLRSKFFESPLLAGIVGLACGVVASLFTYLTYERPIVNPRPFFIAIPMSGLACSLVAYVLASKLEGRSKRQRDT